MTPRFTLALSLIAAAPAIVQPRVAAAQAPAKQAASDVRAQFDQELDALIVAGGLTAEQAATRSVGASPAVRRSAAEIEAAIAQAEAAELARVPQVALKAQYTRMSFIDPVVFGPGVEIPFLQNTYTGTASAAVNLSDYLLRYPHQIEAARLGVEAAKLRSRSAEVNVAQDARLAYYEWVRARLQVLVAQRQLAQVRSTLGQVRALAEAQRVSRADLMRVESNEASSEAVLVQLENLASLREEQLRLLIGAPADTPLAIGEDIRADVPAPQRAQLQALTDTATARRLEFKAIDTGIAAKEKQRTVEKAARYPRLSAFATADYANPNPRVFPQDDRFQFTWVAGAQLTWTLNELLNAGKADARLRAETDQLRADRELLERGTRLEVLAAQQAVVVAQSALATSAKQLAAAEEGYRVRRELLNAERATAVELVDAETDLTRARIATLNARVDLRVALTRLAHATGQDIR